MFGTKSPFTSLSIWGGIAALALGIAPLLGYALDPKDAADLGTYLESLATGAAGVAAIVGRIRASKRIALPLAGE